MGTAASLASRERVWKVLLGALLPEAQVTGAADCMPPADWEGPISRDGDLRAQGRAGCLDICEEAALHRMCSYRDKNQAKAPCVSLFV